MGWVVPENRYRFTKVIVKLFEISLWQYLPSDPSALRCTELGTADWSTG